MPSARTVLAFLLDSADAGYITELMERGEAPALARLREQGTWSSVRSPAHIGNIAVNSTFYTGLAPQQHGFYGGWAWDPKRMRVLPVRTERLRPFWGPLDGGELTVGVLDIPMAPHMGTSCGFEVTEWGPHYRMQGQTSVSPAALGQELGADHPFILGEALNATPADPGDPVAMAEKCVEGAAMRGDLAERLLERARPDLSVVAFTEIHHAAHDLWHTVEPDHPLFADMPFPNGGPGATGLADLHHEVDRQIGRLVEIAGEDAAVVVFSMHGMRPGRGVATLLAPVLRELGFTRELRPGRASPRDLARAALDAVKQRTPTAVKRVYHRRVPRDARLRLAIPTMLPVFDWSRTRAFALPSDQHGWVRVNLRGREAEGAVAPQDYDRTCDELRDALERLQTEDGRPLVTDVQRADAENPPELLPDLVVHYTDAAYDRPVRVREPSLEAAPLIPERTGQHRSGGFCLARGLERPPADSLDATELHRLLIDACAGGA